MFVTVRNTPVVEDAAFFLEFDGIDDYLLAADADRYSFGTGTADTPFTLGCGSAPTPLGPASS
ncbi:MAG: hypothetical protein R2708_12360 [Vicinamibacterales bacterium]